METQLEKTSFPSHKEFCEFIKMFRKDKPPLPLWKSYPLYIFSFLVMGFLIAAIAMSLDGGRKYPSSQYRKVIKEGILWDSVEWHER